MGKANVFEGLSIREKFSLIMKDGLLHENFFGYCEKHFCQDNLMFIEDTDLVMNHIQSGNFQDALKKHTELRNKYLDDDSEWPINISARLIFGKSFCRPCFVCFTVDVGLFP
eukprot:TRINITY_DN1887_c0_g1_i2.p1 TRINITY_DN1887_c0_g1~~TRINITY_DN1887_c0_g1_i2.p1  ORF type:complete len:112 (-),score=15.05 TRINITY_DN1887_c0_g1_i2:399-734(-)